MVECTVSGVCLVAGVLTCVLFMGLSNIEAVPYYEQESSLKQKLLTGLDKDVRPATNATTPTTIEFKFSLVKINGLDETQHTLDAVYYIYLAWTDPRLSWNASMTSLDQIHIPIVNIWYPDVSLFNIEGQVLKHTYGDHAIVRKDGHVMWVPGITAKSWCYINLYRFPFDTQKCILVFGSWVYHAGQIAFKVNDKTTEKAEDFPYYYGSGMEIEWKAMELTQTEGLVNYTDIPEWSDVTVTLTLRRLGRYYQSAFIAPIVLMAFLTPLVFVLPPDAMEKSILGSLLLLAECVLLINFLSVMQPSHYHIPRLVMFYISTFILTSMSVFASTFVCNIAKKGSRRRGVPAWMNTVFLGRCGLRKVLCVETYSPVQRFDALVPMHEDSNMTSDEFGTEMTGSSQNPIERELREIRKTLQALAGRFNNDENYDSLTREWFEISRVLDRLLLVVFYAILILTAVAFLL